MRVPVPAYRLSTSTIQSKEFDDRSMLNTRFPHPYRPRPGTDALRIFSEEFSARCAAKRASRFGVHPFR
jgi:hypothetical protein